MNKQNVTIPINDEMFKKISSLREVNGMKLSMATIARHLIVLGLEQIEKEKNEQTTI